MKLKEFHVKNFRSLKEVSLTNIEELSVFVGANSSGKTNILDAMRLFFNEFDQAPQRNIGAVNDYIWFERRPDSPVELRAVFEALESELVLLLPMEIFTIQSQLTKDEEQSKPGLLKNTNRLAIIRQIVGPVSSASWITKSVTLNGEPLVDFDELVPPVGGPKKAKEPKRMEIPTEAQGRLLQSFSQFFKGKFRLVQAARNTLGSPSRLGDRTSFMQASSEGELVTEGQSLDREHQEKWVNVEEFVIAVSPDIQDVRIIAGQITVKERGSNTRFPVSLVGGGHQEIFSLAHELRKDSNVLYGLEEPEQHLHPELARELFDTLRDLSKDNQVFVTTHSTVFVDKAELSNTWVVHKEKKQTRVVRLGSSEDLKRIMSELGVRPSDVFFSDGIVFVEGPTDRIVLPAIANLIGIDFKELDLSMIPTFGKSSGRYHLTTWTDASRSAQIPFFMVLDKGAEAEAKKYIKDGLIVPNESLFILKKGSIEDYYPPPKLARALEEEFGIKLDEKEQAELEKTPRVDVVEKILTAKGKDPKGWKVSVGTKVASLMTTDEVDDELRSILERIRSRVRTLYMGK